MDQSPPAERCREQGRKPTERDCGHRAPPSSHAAVPMACSATRRRMHPDLSSGALELGLDHRGGPFCDDSQAVVRHLPYRNVEEPRAKALHPGRPRLDGQGLCC